ncbi:MULTISPECIES: NAD(P)-dependent oxidoreductase [Methylomonas]|uniref:2-hydroxy-3-oxopropionate reductase n=2 Tax=Methylomonas TaxID=416 RepID=A0A140E3S3_9GAMM|nr:MULTISPECIES: NAD(P)-dependent oxidoreductase [Methylomonas]AMK75047.1 2-hydroxy-3-oxopropionate reductase [Methylomonas denitrificans]OAI02540.1 2-hydroxy-3-oxopropionate reductase [Methylomonas methanica]TCV83139.1 3-hydroxyisobutyrate dehydrogenase [Methylomonas methanica]
MAEQRYTLGFVGIGLMGLPLTLRLLAAGFQVNVWNRTAAKLDAVSGAGAKASGSVGELVKASDVVILCLADTVAVETVVKEQIIANGSTDKLLIDLSSIHPEATRRMAEELQAACGMRWVDAPVSGGTAGAEQGSLAIMAGGAETDIAIAREVLQPLYSRLTHMGAVGSGQTTKICNQMIVSCNVLVIAEMMVLAKSAGVDAAKIPEALADGFADSKPLQIVGPEMAGHRFEPVKWRVKTLLKDLNMAVDLAGKQGSAVPMSGLAAQLMQLHGSGGFLEQDPSTLIKLYAQD